MYKSGGVGRGRGSLNRVVSKLLAKSDSQCLPPHNSVCDNNSNPIPKSTTSAALPSPVINKLKKLGTSVEVEKSESSADQSIPTGYLQIMESLDKAVGLTSDLTKKKKRRSPKKTNAQVPSSVQLLAEVDGSDNLAKFSFQVDTKQVIELPDGQKLYTCDICSGVYHRGFSLKRHYLKTHINYKHISKRDLHNCGILFDPSIEKGGAQKKKLVKDDSPPIVSNLSPPSNIPDLYRCHTCFKCFMLITDLKAHLMEHPPVSVQNLTEDTLKSYSCPICKSRFKKKKPFLRHKETCSIAPEITGNHNCLFCDKSFPTFVLRKKHHLQMHHPKKKLHQCYLCKTKMFKERLGVVKHLILHHPDEYIGCLPCKLRFDTREELKKHNKETHKTSGTAKKMLIQQKITAKAPDEVSKLENYPIVEQPTDNISNANSNCSNLLIRCTECPKMFASHLNMTRHHRLAHRLMKQKKKLIQKKELGVLEKTSRKTPTPPPLLSSPLVPPLPPPPTDPEVLFYSTIAHNIRENLTHHLDGKLDSQEVLEYDLNKTSSVRNKLLNFSASFTSESTSSTVTEPPPVPLQPKEHRPTPISPRGQWEKFNFPKNYDGRCGLTSYIKDMSHLDISTQLTMRRNLQRLNSTIGQETNKESPANFPAGLLLVEKPPPDCAEAFGDPDVNRDKGGAELVLSGEWVRPRTYLCAACGYKSASLWDTEDHKYALHPNAWIPHVEIVGEQSECWDWFYHRRLPPSTIVKETTPPAPEIPPSCSKCGRTSHSLPDLHRHMLDCGGDLTWMATMLAVTSPGSRRRKWRPFGSRRRKTTGRRGLKRNIPNTPAKHLCGRIRTKPGDMDTIQKMIANLPPKRATRRVIGEDPDIKTRSQSTISSVPISSVAVYSSSARSSGLKLAKLGKGSTKVNQKRAKGDISGQSEEKSRNKFKETVKEEPIDTVTIKEEDISENDLQPLEAENTIQHSDILTSLQMIPVVRNSPVAVTSPEAEGPIETSKIIAAMREAMLGSDEKLDKKPVEKPKEKKRRSRNEKKNEQLLEPKKEPVDGDIIICNGCGMQFDNSSACQRHKKKCVYWKEEKKSDENKSNKCPHCGTVFPYLMALLKHDCDKVMDVAEEPAMPELCPVKPVEVVPFDGVEDIPILSPVGVIRDDVSAKRMSLLEETIREVGSESFDTSGYLEKLFTGDNKTPIIKREKLEEGEDISSNILSQNEILKDDSKSIENKKKNASQSQEKANEDKFEEEPIAVKHVHKSNQNVLVPTLTKLQGDMQASKNKKVSDIFKEIKRRGRKRNHKIKVKIPTKILASKSGLRKVSGLSAAANAKKQILKNKKKGRSSNFAMLMKEWEKLQNEGEVAVGKRKRVFQNSAMSVRQVRSRRRFNSLVNTSDYADNESVTTDTSSIYEQLSVRPRRSRRTNSVGTMNDIPSEILKEITESCSSISSENKDDNIDNDKFGKKFLKDDVEKEIKKEKTSDKSHLTSQDNPSVKKKPGRPSLKKTTVETEQHITEIDDDTTIGCLRQKLLKDDAEEDINTKKASDINVIINESHIISQDEASVKRKPGRPPKKIAVQIEQPIVEIDDDTNIDSLRKKLPKDNVENEIKKEKTSDINVAVNESDFTSQDKPPVKRKPGRPSLKKSIVETEQHIVEIDDDTTISSLRQKLLKDDSEKDIKKEKTSDINVIVNDSHFTSQDELSMKRKPGRPPFKKITVETEQHIMETINSIVKGTRHSGKDDVSKDVATAKKNDASNLVTISSNQPHYESDQITKLSVTDNDNEVNSLLKTKKTFVKKSLEPFNFKTEEHINKVIENIVSDTQTNNLQEEDGNDQETVSTKSSMNKVDSDEHIRQLIGNVESENKDKHEINERKGDKLKAVIETVYNVSIGNAEVFKENSETPSISISNFSQIMVKKRRRRRKGFRQLIKSTPNVNQNSDGNLQTKERDLNELSKSNVIGSKDPNDGKLLTTFDINTGDIQSYMSSQNMLKGKRKLSFSGDEINNVTFKPKEIKTKQLSIADYISISHFVKKSNDNSLSTDTYFKPINDGTSGKMYGDIKERNCEKRLDNSSPNIAKTDVVTQLPSISEMSKTIGDILKKNSTPVLISEKEAASDEKPSSPVSTSSTEDIALSVIREKVIQKKKKKLKLKKLAKNKQIEMIDHKVIKVVKPKLPTKDEKHFLKEKKLTKDKKKIKAGMLRSKIKVGVSRNRWEVSVIEDRPKPVQIVYEGEEKPIETPSTSKNEPVKKFYCTLCDVKFESAYHLYEHQLSPEHVVKNTEAEQESNLSDDNDPVKFCKSIGNIINDLGKHTLNVAKVMHHLKKRESTDEPVEPVASAATAAGVVGPLGGSLPKEEWPSRSTTPLWDTNQQAWEVDSFSTNCSSSLGSIMDTVNKLLSSDPEASGSGGSSGGLGGYSWTDLQLAMGASDEEMAMLEQLGEHSLQEDYVYDNTRPAVEWPSVGDQSTLTDLDHQEQSSPPPPQLTPATASVTPPSTSTSPPDNLPLLSPVRKQEPHSDSEDSKCRGPGLSLSKTLLVDYESRVMVCPSCSKHFLGLPALQTHVAWAHQHNTSKALRRRVLRTDEDVDRRLVCFVCKEIMSTASQLETHIQFMHTKRPDDQQLNKPSLTESAERLKSKMSLALGGLVDKALSKLLGTTSPRPMAEPTTSQQQSIATGSTVQQQTIAISSAAQQQQTDVNTGALHILGRLCAARKRVGNENIKLGSDVVQLLGKLRVAGVKEERAYQELRTVLSRGRPLGVSKGALQASVNSSVGASAVSVPAAVAAAAELKPTNLLDHLAVCSSDIQQRPYVCPICDLRFLIPSTRNRHIARAHGKYGRRYDDTMEEHQGAEDLDYGWKDSLDLNMADEDSGSLLPLCSDCGLSFQSIHEVMQHRIEDHPRRFSADSFQDSKSDIVINNLAIVESSSSEKKPPSEPPQSVQSDDVKLLPVSDNAIDSTSTSKKSKEWSVNSSDERPGRKRKLSSESKKRISQGRNKRKTKTVQKEREEPEEAVAASDEPSESSEDECSRRVSSSPERAVKSPDKHSTMSSEENLAELSRKMDRRKVRMGNMAEEAVRVKAEAALRELNLSRKNKSPSAAAKWGINALKFTKQVSKAVSSSQVNGCCSSKPKFASLIDKKWKMPAQAAVEQLLMSKKQTDETKSDVYDFEDEDLDTNKKPFLHLKESNSTEVADPSESNNPVSLTNVSGSSQKAHRSNKLVVTDSS